MIQITVNSRTRDRLLNADENEGAVHYPDVARWVSVSRASGGKTVAAADHPAGGRAAACEAKTGFHGLRISVYIFECFKRWNSDNCFYLFSKPCL